MGWEEVATMLGDSYNDSWLQAGMHALGIGSESTGGIGGMFDSLMGSSTGMGSGGTPATPTGIGAKVISGSGSNSPKSTSFIDSLLGAFTGGGKSGDFLSSLITGGVDLTKGIYGDKVRQEDWDRARKEELEDQAAKAALAIKLAQMQNAGQNAFTKFQKGQLRNQASADVGNAYGRLMSNFTNILK